MQGVAKAAGDAKKGLAAAHGIKSKSGVAVKTRQQLAKEKDEAERKKVTDTIEGIYTETKTTVEKKLSTLETDVGTRFDSGMNAALSNMQSWANREIDKFKDDRYSGIIGKGRWLADLFRPAPEGIKQILRQARTRFAAEMDALAVEISSSVDRRLKEAKDEVARGQKRIDQYVKSLPKNLQSVGKDAQAKVAERFKELESSIDDKANELAQQLAQKYKEAFDKADQALKKMEEENAGALKKLADKIGEVIKAILEFKEKLMAVIKKGAEVIKKILEDPIGFIGNLIGALKQGFGQFVSNIGKHLKAGFFKWLLGPLGEAGITLPTDLNVWSVLKLILDVLGLTVPWIKAEATKLVGARNMAIIEKLIEYIMITIRGGPKALWAKLKEDLSNLKEMVIDAIQTWLIETVVKSAVAKVVSMFNPVGAIVQAIIMIYNVVMWVINNASRIVELISAVVDSAAAIAAGNIAGAANWIEKALADFIPIAIDFLARLLGLGGFAAKVKGFIEKVQGKVRAAVLSWLKKAWEWVKKMFGKLLGRGKEKPKDKSKSDAEHARIGKATKAVLAQPAAKDVAGDALVKDRQAKAKQLEAQYNPELGPDVKMRITVKSPDKDGKVGFHIHIGPNDFDTDGSAEGAGFTGVLPLYRGIYYTPEKFSREDYKEQIKPTKPPRKAVYSAAAIELAGGKTPDGSDVPEPVLEAAAATVRAELEQKGRTPPVQKWWSDKKQEFANTRAALLQRYVNKYGEFGKELKTKEEDAYKGLSFTKVPFISTTKKAIHAARYAVGAKLNEDIKRRNRGIVGRVFVYLFTKDDLQRLGATDIKQEQTSKTVKIHPHVIKESEVTFTGSVPGQNMVGQVDAHVKHSANTVAKAAENVATTNAGGKEIGKWDS
ncbi:Hypothetical protein A7982_02246 [Minicystis rosea]|nr:Hypothetical protein A7982_02246 [Minicystis rosea]